MMPAEMGPAEILLLLLLAFVAFGPRRKSASRRSAVHRVALALLAACAPALLIMDRAGAGLGLPPARRLTLAGAAALSACVTLLLTRTADRWLGSGRRATSPASPVRATKPPGPHPPR